MLVVDAHVHLWPDNRFMPPEVWKTFHWVWGRKMLPTKDDADMQRLLDLTWDPDGAKLLAEANEADVEAAVVMPMDFGLAVGEAQLPIWDKNERIAEIAAQSQGRIFSFVGVDPRRAEASELLRTAVQRWNCKGLKLYPATGFFPDDERCRSVYETAVELAVPILFHCGPVGYPLKSRYSRPSEIDAVAADFPSLRIILGHVSYGKSWYQEALDVAAWKPNLLVETSGLAGYAGNDGALRRAAREMIDVLGPDRILYGSDRVGFPGFSSKAWVDSWRSLLLAPEGRDPKFSEPEIRAILGTNADREFHLGLGNGSDPVQVWPSYPGSASVETDT